MHTFATIFIQQKYKKYEEENTFTTGLRIDGMQCEGPDFDHRGAAGDHSGQHSYSAFRRDATASRQLPAPRPGARLRLPAVPSRHQGLHDTSRRPAQQACTARTATGLWRLQLHRRGRVPPAHALPSSRHGSDGSRRRPRQPRAPQLRLPGPRCRKSTRPLAAYPISTASTPSLAKSPKASMSSTASSSQPPIPTTVPFRTSASSAPQSFFQRSTLQFLKRFAQLVGTRRSLRATTDAL